LLAAAVRPPLGLCRVYADEGDRGLRPVEEGRSVSCVRAGLEKAGGGDGLPLWRRRRCKAVGAEMKRTARLLLEADLRR